MYSRGMVIKKRKLIEVLVIVAVVLTATAVFYFRFPQIWGSAVYPLAYEDLIKKYSKQFDVPASFIATVIYAESRFNPNAVSGAGARGLMQIMPATGGGIAKSLGETGYSPDKLMDPETSIRYGTYYYRELIDRHQGNIDKALMAYNGGEGAVQSYERRGVLPRETEGYLRKIKGTWDMYEKVYATVWYGENPEQSPEKLQSQEMQKKLQGDINSLQGKEESLVQYQGKKWEFRIFWPPFKQE